MKKSHKERLTKIIDSFFSATDKHTKANFCAYMKLYEINALFREGKGGRIYARTLVDNRECSVFNGSDLGKGYSGQNLTKRLDLKQDGVTSGEKESHQIASGSNEVPRLQLEDLLVQTSIHDVAKEFFHLMKAEKLAEGPITPRPNKTRKKKRGLSK